MVALTLKYHPLLWAEPCDFYVCFKFIFVCVQAFVLYCLCKCVFIFVCERKDERLASCSPAAETLCWNVNWYDWSVSLIRRKAMFNKPKIKMSHCLNARGEGRGRVCFFCFFPLPFSSTQSTSRCLITNRKPAVLQSVRWFTKRLKTHVLLRLEQRGFEVMLMRSFLVLQI